MKDKAIEKLMYNLKKVMIEAGWNEIAVDDLETDSDNYDSAKEIITRAMEETLKK